MRYRITDRIACSLSDLVLLDTDAHIQWFVEEFRLPGHEFRRIWVGADDEVMKPSPSWPSNYPFTAFSMAPISHCMVLSTSLEPRKDSGQPTATFGSFCAGPDRRTLPCGDLPPGARSIT